MQKASKVYRTDLDGIIIITTDGSTYSITTQKTGSTGETKSTPNSTGAYSSTTDEAEPDKSITPRSTQSTVYVSNLNLKDEWVKISNKGSSPVSLNGWKIKDEGSKHTYKFPSYILDSESTVTVYTEKGTSTATELYWELGSLIWNNDGDKACLL